MVEYITESADETRQLGRRIGAHLDTGDVILLSGGLGAGKTTLVQGIAAGMGIEEAVTSPTFTIIHEYGPPSRRLVHIDPYRLEDEEDLVGIGFDEYLECEGVLAVEWSERLGALAPSERLDMKMELLGPDRRRIQVIPRGERYEALVKRLEPC